jgi:hypothetical protein
MRFTVVAAVLASVSLTVFTDQTSQAIGPALPAVHHVWVVNLENEGFANAFTSNPNPYLSRTLPSMGQLLTQYYGIGHVSLDNYIAEISGQGPNAVTQTDCVRYADVLPGALVGGQALGQGCVYPTAAATIADQLTAKGLTWKAYVEDMGNVPARDNTDNQGNCGHPLPNTTDGTQSAAANDQFATRHDPFVYFHSIVDAAACHNDVVSMKPFTQDLASEATTPNFSFVVPNLCNTGHDATCAGTNVRGTHVGGLTAADYWLQSYVPKIVGSPAFKADGLLIVTFDEAGTSDATACCNEQPGLNTALPGLTGPGGGRVGAVLVSPFIKRHTTNATPYNHYSMLRSVEDLLRLDGHLGLAGASGLTAFGSDVFAAGSAPAVPATAVVAPPPAAATPAPGGGTLPATGLPGSRAATVAALLVGVGLFATTRRRRV